MYLDFHKQHERVQFYRLRWLLLFSVVAGREMEALNRLGQTPSQDTPGTPGSPGRLLHSSAPRPGLPWSFRRGTVTFFSIEPSL